MKFWISMICFFLTQTAWTSVPLGLAKVMSIYQDSQSNEKIMITGYGIIVEMRLLRPDQSVAESLYAIQTVSHASMGSYNLPTYSLPDKEGRTVPVPKLLVEIPTKKNESVFAHHRQTQVDPGFSTLVQNQKTFPMIESSYFESFRDADFLILDLTAAQLEGIPAAIRIDIQMGKNSAPEMSANQLELPEDWQWSHVGKNLMFPCPKNFPRCFAERTIQTQAKLSSPVSLHLQQGIFNAEYDSWIPFMTDQGMSGLPVFFSEKNNMTGIAGLISGSAPSAQDTWLTQFYPLELYSRWQRAIEIFRKKGQYYQVYGTGTFLWKFENNSLSRIAVNFNGISFDESRKSNLPSGQSQRCNHGSGFRLDNGSGLQQNNTDAQPPCPEWSRGKTFFTQRPRHQSSPTGFFIMHHPQMTTFFPPTATGMGYFFMQNDLDVSQKNLNMPMAERMSFELFDQSRPYIKKAEFEGFARSIYQTKDQGKTWTADLVVTKVDKSNPQSLTLSETQGTIQLRPQLEDDRIQKIHIDLQIQGLGRLQREIDYTQVTSENSIMNLVQNFVEEQVELNLIGILTHNLDYMNVQDLDMEVRKGNVNFIASPGDETLKTIFTVKKENQIYYAAVLRSQK